MRRETILPRPDWKAKVERLGLTFHTLEGEPYWHEAATYRFDAAEVEILERTTAELHAMCLAAVERTIAREELGRLHIPEEAHKAIADAWEADPPSLYGRFDLVFDGNDPPKMLEYNADTPTSLLEAAVVQWHWLEDVMPDADQFNSIWEGLVLKWRELKAEGYVGEGPVHFGCMEAEEDRMTTAVLMDAAKESGLEPILLTMREIGWDLESEIFVDAKLLPIRTLFKLYPWEWLLRDRFGAHILKKPDRVQWIEPIWKMVLANKGILAILWEMYPDHPALLPAFLDGPRGMSEYVRKPLLGREGANVTLHLRQGTVEMPGPYDGPSVYQAYTPLPTFEGVHVVLGSWVVDGEPRGIGVRESDGPITEDTARFVPHYFCLA